MKFLLVLAGFVLSCSSAYGQWVLLNVSEFTQNNKKQISYKYFDTLSFSINNNFHDTLAYNAKIIDITNSPIVKGVVKASAIESVYNGVIMPSVYMDKETKPYLDRWLERQKKAEAKAKEEKETKGNK